MVIYFSSLLKKVFSELGNPAYDLVPVLLSNFVKKAWFFHQHRLPKEKMCPEMIQYASDEIDCCEHRTISRDGKIEECLVCDWIRNPFGWTFDCDWYFYFLLFNYFGCFDLI